jgi:hypothetical protein
METFHQSSVFVFGQGMTKVILKRDQRHGAGALWW